MLVVAGAAAAVIVPAVDEGKERRAASERRKDAAYQAAKRRRLAEEATPHSGHGDRPLGKLSRAEERAARRELVHDLERAVTRDARARVRAGKLEGPILATKCEINPPSRRRVERDLSVRAADYDCLAIKARDPEGRFVVGHTFDARVDYRRFTFAWAKVCRPPGEGAARLTC